MITFQQLFTEFRQFFFTNCTLFHILYGLAYLQMELVTIHGFTTSLRFEKKNEALFVR